ncbi:hypothetical protein T492DRAFT_1040042 [Pavlovales sp. CCMP2436]|nr:hypothetical protein T492DRAFT_1040042 [Pavlovales sp. CCMP2436]
MRMLTILAAAAACRTRCPGAPAAHFGPSAVARVQRPVLYAPAASRIAMGAELDDRPEGAPAARTVGGVQPRKGLRHWLRQKRVAVSVVFATSAIFGAASPSFAAGRRGSFTPPELETAFRAEKFTWDRLAALGVNKDKIIDRDFIFSDTRHRLSEVEQEIFDYDASDEVKEENRALGFVLYAGGATILAQLCLSGVKWGGRVQARRDAEEMRQEIELTGTYVNPSAKDVEEIENAETGEKKKIKKKKKSKNDPNDPNAGGPANNDGLDDDGKTDVDVLKDLL